MSTVIPNETIDKEEISSNHVAAKNVLKNTYNLVLAALDSKSNIVLITGGAKKGKSALLHTISNNITSKNRVVNLSGKDLPTLDKSKGSEVNPELNNMKDFILESTDLDDTLVVTLDDADQLPLSFIGDLVTGLKNSISNGHGMQLILTAPLSFKEQLLNLEQISSDDVTHCALESMSEEEIHAYVKNKTYKISSDIKRLKFKPGSLKVLADFIQSDLQVLDVILEWCAALVKKDQLSSITPHTVNRAAGFAQQFSKDKGLRLVNSYPPSHEVYKYINDLQSADKPAAKVEKKSVKKPKKNKSNKAFIKTARKEGIAATKIPTVTSKVEQHKPIAPVIKMDDEKLASLKEIEDEIMPTQWTKADRRQKTNQSKSFPVLAGFTSLVVIGFIAFIAYRIGNSSNVPPVAETPPKEQVAQDDIKENIGAIAPKSEQEQVQEIIAADEKVLDQTAPNSVQTKASKATTETTVKHEETKQIVTKEKDKETNTASHTGIIASDTTGATNVKTNSRDKKPEPGTSDTGVNATDSKQKHALQKEQLAKIEAEKKVSLLKTAEINGLLALADQQFDKKQMTTPQGDNALETYQKILSKYPENKSAITGIEKLHNTYVGWANHYLRRKDIQRAKSFYNKALSIDPSDTLSKQNLEKIAKQEAAGSTVSQTSNSVATENTIPSREIQGLLNSAEQKMQQINNDIGDNKRNYKVYQEAQAAYQEVLRAQPKNQQARLGLASLKKYYADWAELQMKSQNYNIALFLYGQALSIDPGDALISQRVEQIRQLKSAAL